MKEIELKLSVEEANLILEALGNLPFSRVYGLIGNIQRQAQAQLGNGQVNQMPEEVPAHMQVPEIPSENKL